jgi:hypothetical protein
MPALGLPFHLTEVDGVPCFWADAPGPCSAGLLFRAGRADEQLATSGITELVERLALAEAGPRRCDASGHVSATTTAFYAAGEPDEVASFLGDVCRALAALPAERFDSERRAMAIESERHRPSVDERLLTMRFGATGFGLPFYAPLGPRWLTFGHVAAWAAERFTSGNAALWMTCPPPAGLRLPLPPGTRAAPAPVDPIAALELPAYAASGTGPVSSTVVGERGAAIGVASGVVADRAHAVLVAERGLADEVSAWQVPLGADLSHRRLTVACADGAAPEATDVLLGIYSAVAADGPTSEELGEAAGAQVRALAGDAATAGGLDRMAVDELLGAPRLWKEDLAARAESVSYADAAAALRSALATQIVVAPAGTPKPAHAELADFPWFSRERVEGMELRPARGQRRRGEPEARLVVSQIGVTHLGDAAGQASTVKFDEVAAALQEPDGSLTLVGRDGAIVQIDPAYFKGAGQIAADLERRLPPELVVPPRDAMPGHGAGVEQVARRKLRRLWLFQAELALLRDRLDHQEELVTMCEAVVGVKPGLLALTDRRVIFVSRGDREPVVRELPYDHVLDVKLGRVPSLVVTLRSPAGETAFSQIGPKERAPEVVDEIQRRRIGLSR